MQKASETNKEEDERNVCNYIAYVNPCEKLHIMYICILIFNFNSQNPLLFPESLTHFAIMIYIHAPLLYDILRNFKSRLVRT